MKKLILSGVILMLFAGILTPEMKGKSNLTTAPVQNGDVDEHLELAAGQSARASDGTYISPANYLRVITFCPGWGWFCRGSATIGGVTQSYNGSKGIGKPDIIIVES